ncbi:protein Stu1p [[Candida] railenensis]|uniref:Protein STU1 n=1 Tax=[Candida] railenensis TaxID=45579 RepID=A0A9P0QNM0_9ASCO|nr:protein Stu1p [[Candida] railenensis]
MPITGDELFSVVTSSKNPAEILDAVNEFKAFVKKEFVDINQVPKYMEALCISVDYPGSVDVQVSSFAVIAHLVKRVSMQDHSGKVLNSQSFLVLPVILKRLGDPKASARSQAKRALEAYWFSAPQDVEMALIEIALGSTNLIVVQESINWITHIFSNVSHSFKIDDFLHGLIRIIITIDDEAIVDSIRNLFVQYYSSKSNQSSRHMLMSELTKNRVSQKFCEQVLKEIEGKDTTVHIIAVPNVSTNANPAGTKSNFITSSSSTRAKVPNSDESLFKKSSSPSNTQNNNSNYPKSKSPDTSHINVPEITDPELIKIASKYANYKFDVLPSGISIIDVDSSDILYNLVSSLAPPFEGKETEFNWISREKNIIQLRSILRGNSAQDLREDLVNCLKEISEPICKAVMSLRTSLSIHGCQLIKECAMILTTDFDALIELFIPTLTKLCSATKHIASTNSNVAIVSIYMNCSFSSKLVSKIQQSSLEKNFQPRSYCGVWLQIFLHRFHNSSQHSIEAYTKVIAKLLGDQNPTVRQAAKDTFWVFWTKFPSQGEAMLPKLEGNIVRALERSRPKQGASPGALSQAPSIPSVPISRKQSKPSIRESIIARNREIREKQRESGINSRPSSNMDIVSDEEKKVKLSLKASSSRLGGGPRRNFTHDPTSSTATSSTNSSSAKSRVASAGSTGDHKRDHSYQKSSFDLHADPIIKFLSSNQSELKVEGVNLLKFAILGEEELSPEIKGLVTSISVSNPIILKPLFLGSEDLLRKTFKYFTSSEDFIRVCCVLQDKIDARYVELIMSFVPLDEIYKSFSIILGYATKISSILNNSDLVMQMIKYKTSIFKISLEFLALALQKIPISDEIYSELISSLFEMVTILRSTDLHEKLLNLLSKFYLINEKLFEKDLHDASISIRDEIGHIMQDKKDDIIIDDDDDEDMSHHIQNLSVSYPSQISSSGTSYDLTKVVYQPSTTIPRKGSPLKEQSDLTMLVPTFGSKNEFTFQESKRSSPATNLDAEPQFDMVVEDNIDLDEYEAVGTTGKGPSVDNMEMDNIDNAEGDNVFVDQGPIDDSTRSRKSDLFSKFNKENSTELVQDFAQVQIGGEHPSNLENPIQLFIDKVDPLNKVSNKKKQIQIYQDESIQGSPQKQREYNYNEMNWFNYSVAKYRVDDNTSHVNSVSNSKTEDELSIEKFKSLCSNFGKNSLQNSEFLELLNFLQERNYTAEFCKFLDSQGAEILENSFWNFFELFEGNDDTLSSHSLFSGLLLLKQVLVNRAYIDLSKLWGTLFSLSEYSSKNNKNIDNNSRNIDHEMESISNEVTIAINEIFDEILVGSYSTQEILSLFMTVLQSINQMSYKRLVFVLESFYKLLNVNTIGFSLSDQVISHIDLSLGKFLNNESVVVRRCVVSIYGKLLKANLSIEVNKIENSEEKNIMDKILQRVPIPQKKLIEYYAQN